MFPGGQYMRFRTKPEMFTPVVTSYRFITFSASLGYITVVYFTGQ